MSAARLPESPEELYGLRQGVTADEAIAKVDERREGFPCHWCPVRFEVERDRNGHEWTIHGAQIRKDYMRLVATIRDEHRPFTVRDEQGIRLRYCRTCLARDHQEMQPWPCPTARALERAR